MQNWIRWLIPFFFKLLHQRLVADVDKVLLVHLYNNLVSVRAVRPALSVSIAFNGLFIAAYLPEAFLRCRSSDVSVQIKQRSVVVHHHRLLHN